MIKYTIGNRDDCTRIAELHAQSWKHHYRGIMSDQYLDEEIDDERLEVWTDRFDRQNPNQMVILATSNEKLCGFACHFLDYNSIHGNYLDNLHVSNEFQGQGIGRKLMQLSIRHCMQFDKKSYYLWVFAQNVDAIEFYRRLGGRLIKETKIEVPPGQCAGHPAVMYKWDYPDDVLQLL